MEARAEQARRERRDAKRLADAQWAAELAGIDRRLIAHNLRVDQEIARGRAIAADLERGQHITVQHDGAERVARYLHPARNGAGVLVQLWIDGLESWSSRVFIGHRYIVRASRVFSGVRRGGKFAGACLWGDA